MNIRRLSGFCLIVACVTLTTGCLSKSWKPSWALAGTPKPSEEATQLLETAREKFAHAGDAVKLFESMDAYRAVIKSDPGNVEALAYLGNQYILLGTAYTTSRSDKKRYFREAMRYTELAMYTNPEFKKEVDAGKKPWEAAHTLTAKEVQAMLFWVTALQYDFKEGMSLPAKIVNIGWMHHCITFLDQIKKVDPEFGHGAVEFAYTICYCALPGFKGGDKDKGIAYMKEAVEKSKGYLLPRWGRGKYYHQVTGEKETSRADLRWLLKQKLEDYQDPYPWRVHFLQDAQIQLADL